MFTKLLHLCGVVIVAFIVFFIIKLVLESLGVAIPAIIVTLVGLLILIAVIIWAIRAFGLDI